jgi:hypothetical protein
MLMFLGLIGIVLLIIIIFRLIRGKNQAQALKLSDLGTIMDRSISAYRRHVLATLILSTVCVILGTNSVYSGSIFGLLTAGLRSTVSQTSLDTMLSWSSIMVLIGALGIGKTLLAYGAALAMYTERTDQPVTIGSLVPRQRIGAVVALVALMIIPSLLAAFLGWIGGLVALLWALAPVVMAFEGLRPWAAMKRSVALVRKNYSGLLNTLVPLWLIGWIVVGTPLLALLWVMQWLGLVQPSLMTLLLLGCWLIGQICVAPITAYGAACFYLYLQERDAPPMATWEGAAEQAMLP